MNGLTWCLNWRIVLDHMQSAISSNKWTKIQFNNNFISSRVQILAKQNWNSCNSAGYSCPNMNILKKVRLKTNYSWAFIRTPVMIDARLANSYSWFVNKQQARNKRRILLKLHFHVCIAHKSLSCFSLSV